MFLGYNYRIMKKYLAGLGIIALVSIFVTCQKEKYAYDSPSPAADGSKATVASTNKVNPPSNSKDAQGNLPRWEMVVIYRVFGWPEGVTVWALFLTLITIAEQTSQTRKAADAAKESAKAALLNAEVLINSERAWLLATLGPFMESEDTQAIVAKNCGRTPAKVIRYSRINVRIVDHESDLPRSPIYEEFDPLTDPLILLPEGFREFSTFSEKTIRDACDPDTFLSIQRNKKQAFIYGKVIYQDMLATDKPAIRETAWCCQYIPVVAGKFWMHGPPRYNDHT
jgi:hypothetical protein